MTQQEFNEINWHRGNAVKLENGKEYLVKGTKGHGKYLLLFSYEYEKCFIADHKIVVCRTCDYEEPEEVYLEHKRQKQEEAEALREAERLQRLKEKAERKLKNIQEQERIHQEAVARKAAKLQKRLEQMKEDAKKKAEAKKEAEVKAAPVIAQEPAAEQPKKKRQRIKISHAEKVKF